MSTPMPAHAAAIPDTLRILRARELADQGRLREAEAGLAGADSPSAPPELLHALAVVVTRQGDYARARRLWRQLAQIRPADPEIEDMIEAIEIWQTRPAWIAYVPHAAAAVLVLVLTLVLWPRGTPAEQPAYAQPAYTQPLAVVPVAPTAPVAATPVRNTVPAPARPVAIAPQPEPAPMVMFELPPPKPRR